MISDAKLQITVSFKGLDSSDAVRDYANKRLSKLSKTVDHLTNCHLVCLIEKTQHIAQLHVVSGDFDARAEAKAETMYAAIDEVTDKMLHQARKHKEKQKDHSGRGHHNQDS